MMRECPYSTKTRELLGNPSPLPSRFLSTLEISLGLRPREISRVSGNLSGVGDGFPNTSRVLVEHGYNLSASIFRQGVDQKILPCGQGRIDSVEINPSLRMMTDCPCSTKTREVLGNPSLCPPDFPRPSRFPSSFALRKSLGSQEKSRCERFP